MQFKRGQLTLFVIVGIMVIAIFAFLFFAVQTVSRSQLETQATNIFQQIVSSTSLNYYVSLCAQQSLEEGLNLIGQQGGKIFDYQGGNYPLQDYLPLDGHNVSYAIERNRQVSVLQPPAYPCTTIDQQDPANQYSFQNCSFSFPATLPYKYSLSLLPPLCKSAADCRFQATYCKPQQQFYCAPGTIQGQLESFVSNRTKECVKLETILGLNTTYSLEKGNVTTNISIGDNDVTATINFPLLIRLAGSNQPIAKFARFSSTISARLKKAYMLADDMISRNTENLDFNMLKNFNDSPVYTSGLQVIRFDDVRNFDDVYRINDTRNSTFPYFFQFAVENRIPVLNYIGKGTFDPICNITFDVSVRENSTLNINPQGFDEDFDNLTYNYSEGWKATWNETYQNSNQPQACPSSVIASIQSVPNAWENSKIDGKNSSVLVSVGEVGIHNLTIKVSDPEFTDWQIVRIFVYAMLRASGKINSSYADIVAACPQNCTSLEDPLLLTAQVYGGSPGAGYNYTWTDAGTIGPTTSDFYILTNTIKTITTTVQAFLGTVIGQHNIQLTVTNNETVTSTTPTNVYECLPHRSNDQSYPYNTGSDAFAANHSCCSSQGTPGTGTWGTVLDPANICFTTPNPTYGIPSSFDDTKYFNNDYDNGAINVAFLVSNYTTTGSAISNPLTQPYDNDIFNRTFKRKCDGVRGNICVGNALEERRQMRSCNDSNYGTGGQYRCAGPSAFGESSSSLACINYTLTTLEYIRNITSDVRCNTTSKCSNGTYSVSGPKLCSGASCNSGLCNSGFNCNCAVSCGATCTNVNQVSWTSTTCQYGCSLGSCNFQSSTTTACSSTDSQDNNGARYCINGNYCYNVVNCTTSGAVGNLVQYCPTAGTVSRLQTGYLVPINTTTDWCFSGTRSCNQLGACSLTKTNTTQITQTFGCILSDISATGISCFNTTTRDCTYLNANPCDNNNGWKISQMTTSNCALTDRCTSTGCQP